MSKKSLGLDSAHDYGAGMRSSAEKAMPEIANMARGGKSKHPHPSAPKIRAIAPQMGMNSMPPDGGIPAGLQPSSMPPDPNSMPPNGPGQMKKGGKVMKFAKGGTVKGKSLNSQEASKSGGFDPEKGKPAAHGKKANVAYKSKGGKACFAAGGVAKVRHNAATKAGAPMSPKVKFHGKSGVRGG